MSGWSGTLLVGMVFSLTRAAVGRKLLSCDAGGRGLQVEVAVGRWPGRARAQDRELDSNCGFGHLGLLLWAPRQWVSGGMADRGQVGHGGNGLDLTKTREISHTAQCSAVACRADLNFESLRNPQFLCRITGLAFVPTGSVIHASCLPQTTHVCCRGSLSSSVVTSVFRTQEPSRDPSVSHHARPHAQAT
jgi:hypothetical protein